MGKEAYFLVAPVERQVDVPDWFKELGIKQQGLRVWRMYTEPEMRELVYGTTGKRGKQLRRFFERRPLRPRYYVCTRAKDGKLLRPFCIEESVWLSMPWIA